MVTILYQTASDISLSNKKQANNNLTTLSIRGGNGCIIRMQDSTSTQALWRSIRVTACHSKNEEYQSGCCREGSGRRRRLRRRQHMLASGDRRAKPKSAQRSIWPGQFTSWRSLTWVLWRHDNMSRWVILIHLTYCSSWTRSSARSTETKPTGRNLPDAAFVSKSNLTKWYEKEGHYCFCDAQHLREDTQAD